MAAQSAIGTTATTPRRVTRKLAVNQHVARAVDTLHAYRESEAREEGMTQPYDELECLWGPCDGCRLKIPRRALV